MPAHEIASMVASGVADVLGGAHKPASDGSAPGTRDAFLALLGPVSAGSVAGRFGGLHEGAWRDLSQGLFRAGDDAPSDKSLREARPRSDDRDDHRRRESVSLDDEPAPTDRRDQSRPARESRASAADDRNRDGSETAGQTRRISEIESEGQPVVAVPQGATAPAPTQTAVASAEPTATAVPTKALGSVRPAGVELLPNEPTNPVPAGAGNKPQAPTSRDIAAGDRVPPPPTPGGVQVTVSRDAERLLSRPAPTFSADSHATALSAQAGASRVTAADAEPRHHPNGAQPGTDTLSAGTKPGATPQQAIGQGPAPAANANLAQLAAAGGGTMASGAALKVTPGAGAQVTTVATGAPAPVTGAAGGMNGQLARFEAAGNTAPSQALEHNARPVVHQVAVNITKAIENGADRISIQLKPAALGRVDVKLEVAGDGRVQVAVTADRPETLEMLQRDARGLERALQDAGLRTDGNSLSFSLRGGHNPHEGAQPSTNPGGDPAVADAADDAAVDSDPAVSGGIDIRV